MEIKYLTIEDLKELYPKLAEPLPQEAIQFADTKAYKGYNSTGLGYAFVMNRFNEVLGIGHLNILHEIVKEIEKGNMTEVTIHMTLQIGNWRLREDGTSYFEVLAQRDCYGGHSSKSYYDALKGSFTNSFKKCGALFGPGRQAYEGSLDDDFVNPDGSTGESKIGVAVLAQKNNKSNKEEPKKEVQNQEMKTGKARTIDMMLNKIERKKTKGETEFELNTYLSKYGVEKWEAMTDSQAEEFIKELSVIVRGK